MYASLKSLGVSLSIVIIATLDMLVPGNPIVYTNSITLQPHYYAIFEALPGVLGEKGHLFQGNKGTFFRGNGEREQRHYWGTGNIRKQFSIFGQQGNKPIYFEGAREQVHPHPLWEGLIFAVHRNKLFYK